MFTQLAEINIYSLSIKWPRAVIRMIGDALGRDGLIQHVEHPFLIARIVMEIEGWWWWRVRRVLVVVDLGMDAGKVYELSREPYQPQQKPN